MSHVCRAGRHKLVIMSDGRIIPCEAFKGLVDVLPELCLGTIDEENCFKLAIERAKEIKWLTCFQDRITAEEKFKKHVSNCQDGCQEQDTVCTDGLGLLIAWHEEQTEKDRLIKEVKEKIEGGPVRNRTT